MPVGGGVTFRLKAIVPRHGFGKSCDLDVERSRDCYGPIFKWPSEWNGECSSRGFLRYSSPGRSDHFVEEMFCDRNGAAILIVAGVAYDFWPHSPAPTFSGKVSQVSHWNKAMGSKRRGRGCVSRSASDQKYGLIIVLLTETQRDVPQVLEDL